MRSHTEQLKQQMPCKMETCVEFPMAPQIVAVEHRKNYDVAGFPLELECLDDGQGTERDKIASWSCENGGECCWSEKTARNGAGTVVETLAQNWQWIEMCNMVLAIRDRMLSWAGHVARMDYKEICAKALRCRGLTMVEMETAKLERGGERQMVWPTPTTVQNLQVGGHGCWGGLQICWERGWSVENCPRQHGLVAFCSKPWKLEAIFEMWKKPCIDGPGCLGDPSASGMTGTNAVVAWLTEKRIVREEIWRALATPLSVSSQLGHCRDALMVQCWLWLVGII